MGTLTSLTVSFISACAIATDNNVSNEASCVASETVTRLEYQLYLKEQELRQYQKQLEDLTSRSINSHLTDEPDSFTCADQAEDLHIVTLEAEQQCIFECHDADACSDHHLSCSPYNSCRIECYGHRSCNHLVVDFIDGAAVNITCPGFLSCIGLQFNALKEYPVEDGQSTRGYDPFEDESFEWYLPDVEIRVDKTIPLTLNNDNVISQNHFLVAKRIFDKDMLQKVLQSATDCNHAHGSEHRKFGGDSSYEIYGHDVVFMDDCITDELYAFFKRVSQGLLRYLQMAILQEMKRDGINVYGRDVDGIMNHIDGNWLHDWQNYISIGSDLESRVIEYIRYENDGHLGWHKDGGSNFTMVAMLSSSSRKEYEGGKLHFRLNDNQNSNKFTETVLLDEGDVALFPSMCDHLVSPITAGERHVMVIEWWNLGRAWQPERTMIEDHLSDLKEQARIAAGKNTAN